MLAPTIGSDPNASTGSTITCAGTPSIMGNSVRSDSWRSSTSVIAPSKAATSNRPLSLIAMATLYAAEVTSN